MDKNTSLKYRIDFKKNISDNDSIIFSESVSQELLNEHILFFDQWGVNFCEGFLDVKDYIKERKPEALFYEILKKNRLFEFVRKTKVVLDDNRLEYIISIIDNQKIEIKTNSPKNGGLTIYYDLTDEEKTQYLVNGIETLKDRIKDMSDDFGKYKVVSWR